MAKVLTKTQKYEKIRRLVRKHGQLIVLFEDVRGWPFGDGPVKFVRRRKIKSNGDCWVSYLRYEKKLWTAYEYCCFIVDLPRTNLHITMQHMKSHDHGDQTPFAYKIGRKVIKL